MSRDDVKTCIHNINKGISLLAEIVSDGIHIADITFYGILPTDENEEKYEFVHSDVPVEFMTDKIKTIEFINGEYIIVFEHTQIKIKVCE